MSFVLDTCALSELTRPKPDPGLITWFQDQDSDNLYVSVLSIGELEKGLELMTEGKKKRLLATWLADLRSTYAARVLVVDDVVATGWGRISAAAQRRGETLGVVDGLIAATAIQRGFAIVTRNVSDFTPSGAAVVNPWRGAS